MRFILYIFNRPHVIELTNHIRPQSNIIIELKSNELNDFIMNCIIINILTLLSNT